MIMKTVSFALVLSAAVLFSQNDPYLDSLYIEAQKENASFSTYSSLSNHYLYADLDSAAHYLYLTQKSVQNQNDQIECYNLISTYHYFNYNLDSAIVYADMLLKMGESIDSTNLTVRSLNKLLILSSLTNNVDQFDRYKIKALALMPQLEDINTKTKIYSSIGSFLFRRNQYDDALVYYLKVDSLYIDDTPRGRGLAMAYENIGAIYTNTYDTLALHYYDQAEDIYESIDDQEGLNNILLQQGMFYNLTSQFDKAVAPFEAAQDFIEAYGQADALSRLYDGLIISYINTGQIAKARLTQKKAQIEIEKHNDPNLSMTFHIVSGEFFYKSENYNQALFHFNEGMKYAEDIDQISAGNQEEILKGIKKTHAALGNWQKAYLYGESFQTLSDSLTKKRNYDKYQQLESKFQNQKKTEEIALLKVENELTAQRSRTSQIIYSTLIGLISLTAIGLYLLYRNRQKTNEKLKELDQFKQSLFTSISHEYRTPLTVIEGLSRRLMRNATFDTEDLKSLNAIMNNSKRLKSLTNQIIDLNTIDAGKMTLDYVNGDIYRLLRDYGQLFESFTSSKRQTMHLDIPSVPLQMDFDEEKIQTILYNLISNAYKFTPDGGNIYLKAKAKVNNLIITVVDDGAGISKQDVAHIFDRFFMGGQKVDNSSGIGLSLVKELAELMDGTVSVYSEINEGSTFSVSLPIRNKVNTPASMNLIEPFVQRNISMNDAVAISTLEQGAERPKLLVVEDNSDIQYYLNTLLHSNFEIFSAENGLQGLEVLANEDIDLILSDLMMPEMDGFEFSQRAKSNKDTSHIPIITISAKNSDEAKAKALSIGIEHYIVKPFSESELVSIIQNVMQKRKIQMKALSDILDIQSAKKTNEHLQQKDLDLISTIQKIVLSESDIQTVTQLASSVHLNSKMLQSKIKSLTGLTVNQYINHIRLKKAQELLRNSTLTISEIAYEVCYKDPAYFSRIFKKQLGLSPKDYKEQN